MEPWHFFAALAALILLATFAATLVQCRRRGVLGTSDVSDLSLWGLCGLTALLIGFGLLLEGPHDTVGGGVLGLAALLLVNLAYETNLRTSYGQWQRTKRAPSTSIQPATPPADSTGVEAQRGQVADEGIRWIVASSATILGFIAAFADKPLTTPFRVAAVSLAVSIGLALIVYQDLTRFLGSEVPQRARWPRIWATRLMNWAFAYGLILIAVALASGTTIGSPGN